MKRIVLIISLLTIFLSVGSVCFAEEEFPTPTGGTYFHVEDAVEAEISDNVSLFFNSSSQPLEEYIVEKLLARESVIDVSAYGMTSSEFSDNYFGIILRHPELLVKTVYARSMNGDIVSSINPSYYFATEQETAEAKKELEDMINKYVALAQQAPDALGKILLVHDKIAYDYCYDNDYEEEVAGGDHFAYHPYGFILRGKAVCQGYAGLLYAVATKLGIEADFCNASAINHIWNYIKIDGNWYHVDLTWGDPTYYADEEKTQLVRAAYHKYFMRSDADYANGNHGATSTYNRFGGDLYECNSTKFESKHLFNLSNLYLINYSDGGYYLRVDSEVTFEYPTLYTGPMLVTKPYESVADGTTPVYKIVYVYTGKAGREYISFVRRLKDGTMEFGQSFLTTDTNFHYSTLRKTNDGAQYSFFFFDRTSLAPLSVKHTIVDN